MLHLQASNGHYVITQQSDAPGGENGAFSQLQMDPPGYLPANYNYLPNDVAGIQVRAAAACWGTCQ